MNAPSLSPDILSALQDAATAAAERLPSSEPLIPGEPTADVTGSDVIPADATVAVLARLTGAVRGQMAIVVAADLVTALQQSPLGALELVPAVQPALEAAAATLGQVVVEAGQELSAELALDGLRGVGNVVVIPLLAGGVVQATFALALAAAPVTAPANGVPRPRAGLDLLRDVEMEVTAELGRTRMTVGELLSLAPGAVVELDRAAGSPADVLVNGTLLARGEVVVVDEDFGIRITEIVSGEGTAAPGGAAVAGGTSSGAGAGS